MDFELKTFVLGVGAQKSGTTWLHDYLANRGDIFMPACKEMHYFNRKYSARNKRKSRAEGAGQHAESTRAGSSYWEFFRKHVPDEIELFGEITPAYALLGEAGFREIRGLFQNIRVIFIMRDPVERFYSQMRLFRDKCRMGNRPERDIEWQIGNPKFNGRSRYQDTIRYLEAVFGKDDLIYLFYESLFRRESIEYLCDALGICYKPANFEAVVNYGRASTPVPDLIRKRLAAEFESTYLFCRQKFGAEVPAEWHFADLPGNDYGPGPTSYYEQSAGTRRHTLAPADSGINKGG
jgi:hypothetical protein